MDLYIPRLRGTRPRGHFGLLLLGGGGGGAFLLPFRLGLLDGGAMLSPWRRLRDDRLHGTAGGFPGSV
jgi:hypothetical protein